jgi:transcriptional regulator with XRE-family HTH domain
LGNTAGSQVAFAGESMHKGPDKMGTFAERLRHLRDQAGQTQEDVARAVGTIGTTVSRWERAQGLPHADQLVALSKHFSVTVDHLLLGQPHENRVKSPEFHKFLATEYGRIAQQRGWVNALLTLEYPFPPSAQLYKNLVHALLLEEEETKAK